ncbi:MAG: toll/interleukin-1 receptor domain-containing protein [Azospirillaceae bacterium]
MKVFISWSGEVSEKVASEFHTWLPGALQIVRPYFTPSDIEKGARWGSEISQELESSDVGVLFITRENIGSPWLIYEAGALSKSLEKARVCPIVLDVSHNDLPAPLRQFQAAEFNEPDMKKILRTINGAAGSSGLEDSVLDSVFDLWWPKLEQKVHQIMDGYQGKKGKKPIRSDREMLEEILELSRLTYNMKSSQKRSDSPVSPRAIKELITAIQTCMASLQYPADSKKAAESLSGLQKPLVYLLSKANLESNDLRSEIIKQVESINFSVSEALDDEIPF